MTLTTALDALAAEALEVKKHQKKCDYSHGCGDAGFCVQYAGEPAVVAALVQVAKDAHEHMMGCGGCAGPSGGWCGVATALDHLSKVMGASK